MFYYKLLFFFTVYCLLSDYNIIPLSFQDDFWKLLSIIFFHFKENLEFFLLLFIFICNYKFFKLLIKFECLLNLSKLVLFWISKIEIFCFYFCLKELTKIVKNIFLEFNAEAFTSQCLTKQEENLSVFESNTQITEISNCWSSYFYNSSQYIYNNSVAVLSDERLIGLAYFTGITVLVLLIQSAGGNSLGIDLIKIPSPIENICSSSQISGIKSSVGSKSVSFSEKAEVFEIGSQVPETLLVKFQKYANDLENNVIQPSGSFFPIVKTIGLDLEPILLQVPEFYMLKPFVYFAISQMLLHTPVISMPRRIRALGELLHNQNRDSMNQGSMDIYEKYGYHFWQLYYGRIASKDVFLRFATLITEGKIDHFTKGESKQYKEGFIYLSMEKNSVLIRSVCHF